MNEPSGFLAVFPVIMIRSLQYFIDSTERWNWKGFSVSDFNRTSISHVSVSIIIRENMKRQNRLKTWRIISKLLQLKWEFRNE